jgi:hypothetical protein
LDEIFAMIDLKYSLSFLSWKRCTEEVNHFSTLKKSEVFINGSFSMQRAEDFYLTTPIHETHQVIFYSKKNILLNLRLPVPLTSITSNYAACRDITLKTCTETTHWQRTKK